MPERTKKKLDIGDAGLPTPPDPVPNDPEKLLDLMDDAINNASQAQGATAPKV